MSRKYRHPDCREPRVGDWVRFYRNGLLVLGVVHYIKETEDLFPYMSAKATVLELYTDNGSVSVADVIEMRR